MQIRFDRGMLVVTPEDDREDPGELIGIEWHRERQGWCAPAERYASVVQQLVTLGVRISDRLPERRIELGWAAPGLRWCRREALDRWQARGCRGELEVDANKLTVGAAAICRLGVATLCLVPSRELAEEWVSGLAAALRYPIAQLDGAGGQITGVTVATYASAPTWAPDIGDRFGLVIIDDAHALAARCPRELLAMLVAPARLTLVRTSPEAQLDPRAPGSLRGVREAAAAAERLLDTLFADEPTAPGVPIMRDLRGVS
jgi:hypothetical protein